MLTTLTTVAAVFQNSELGGLYELAQVPRIRRHIGLNTGVFVGHGLTGISLCLFETCRPISLCWRRSTSQRAEIADCLTLLALSAAVWEVLLTETCHVATGERHCFGWYSVKTGAHVLLRDSRSFFLVRCVLCVCFEGGDVYSTVALNQPLYPVTSNKSARSDHLLYTHTHSHTASVSPSPTPALTQASALALLSLTPCEMTLWPVMTLKTEGSWGFWLDLCVPAVPPADTSISSLRGERSLNFMDTIVILHFCRWTNKLLGLDKTRSQLVHQFDPYLVNKTLISIFLIFPL